MTKGMRGDFQSEVSGGTQFQMRGGRDEASGTLFEKGGADNMSEGTQVVGGTGVKRMDSSGSEGEMVKGFDDEKLDMPRNETIYVKT